MASSIIETDPQSGIDQPASVVRNNFVRAKIEIEELQDEKINKSGDTMSGLLKLAALNIAELPDPATNLAGIAVVTDSGPNPIPVYSNGIAWLKFSDDSAI